MRLLAVLASVLVLSGCAGDAQVEALSADPMATWSRSGVREGRVHVTEPGTSLGKPRYARVMRILEVRDGTDVDVVLAELRSVATGSGWTMTFRSDHAFGAEKGVTIHGEDFRVELTSGRQTIGGPPGVVEAYVSLTAYPA
jgi:hypothetical protein